MPLDEPPRPVDHDPVELARALKATMGSRTQLAICAATGIDQGRLSRILRNERNERPTLDEVLRIEAACGQEPGYVLALAGIVSVRGVQEGVKAARASARTRSVQ